MTVVRGGRELVLALIVVVSAPICVTWAREAFTVETPVAPAAVALTPVSGPEWLPTRYGLSIVAMPEPPSHNAMADVHVRQALACPLTLATLAAPLAFVCPDVRAIVTGDDAFAIIAWDDSSYVAKPGQVLSTPVGDVKLHRLRPRSLTLTHGDDTLQCSLKR